LRLRNFGHSPIGQVQDRSRQDILCARHESLKSDLKVQTPKAGSKIGGSSIEVKWDAYPDAAYYKMSIYADLSSGAQTNYDYINKRVDGLSYVLDKPLAPGSYTCKVEAYNGNDRKLAESSDDIKFTVTGEAKK